MKKVEHLGLAVKDIESAIATYEKLLGSPCYKREVVSNQKVETAFFKVGETKIELLSDTSGKGPIAKFIQNRGEGLHHTAYLVDDMNSALQSLKAKGFSLLPEYPQKGADNMIVAFLHPKDCSGVLTEICCPM